MYKTVLLVFICFVSCKENEKDKKETIVTAVVESETDKIKLTGLDSRTIDLNQYKGKTIFLNFWAT